MIHITARRRIGNERGAFAVIFAVVLMVLLGFVALGIEAGRWFLVRAELAKAVDGAALEAAKNISNPFVDPLQLAREFGVENFPVGYVGTPSSGAGTVQFTATFVDNDKISVTGNTNALAILARLFGVDSVPVSATGIAQKKAVEIMMILDRSGSMGNGGKMENLKAAATGFLDFFQDTQDRDKIGLVSFSHNVTLDRVLGTNFVSPMKAAIEAMIANSATNMELALATAGRPGGFTDQTGLPGDRRVEQYAIFFSDGQPNCFSGKFKHKNVIYDAGVCITNDCRPFQDAYGNTLGNWLADLNGPNTIKENGRDINPVPTGTGLKKECCNGSTCVNDTTKWYIFETRPLAGYSPEYCDIPVERLNKSYGYVCTTASDLTLERAQELKAKGIKVYVIGLGTSTEINEAFLKSLSSGPDFTYFTPRPSDLQAIFNKIAKDIKLRLVY